MNPFAFPTFEQGESGGLVPVGDGLTMRDWFAGQSLIGQIANEQCIVIANEADRDAHVFIAETAYMMADAMLAARTKRPSTPQEASK